jgi:hypothetical protein
MSLLNPAGVVKLYDSVICGPYVGTLFREGSQTSTIWTRRDMVDVPAKAPMRSVIPRELAEQVLRAFCEGGPENPKMPVWARAWDNRDVFIAEMAAALYKSPRFVAAALRNKDPSVPVPHCPWLLSGYEYLGTFRVTRGLIIADRCYVDQEHILLARKTPALAGTWHAYIRHDPTFAGRNIALLVVHEDHFERAKDYGEALGHFGVDAGCAIIVDQRVLDDSELVHALKESSEWDEGLIRDVGIYAHTYDGDGVYTVRGIRQGGDIVAVRANVTRDANNDYHTPPPSEEYTKSLEEDLEKAGPAKPYAPTEKFVPGDRVIHKKFGTGLVESIVEGGKVEIAFPEGVKLLVHGQKK